MFDHGDELGVLVPEVLARLEGVELLGGLVALEAQAGLLVLDELGELVAVDEARDAEVAGGGRDGLGDRLEEGVVVAVDEESLGEFDPGVEGALLGEGDQPVTLEAEQVFVKVHHLDSVGSAHQVSPHGGDGGSHVVVLDHGAGLLGGEVSDERLALGHLGQGEWCLGGDEEGEVLLVVLIEDLEARVESERRGGCLSEGEGEGSGERHLERYHT